MLSQRLFVPHWSARHTRTTDEYLRLESTIRTFLIRDLVERFPEIMPVLSGYGIDVCCGGAHTVPEAARAHGHEAEEVVEAVIGAVKGEGR